MKYTMLFDNITSPFCDNTIQEYLLGIGSFNLVYHASSTNVIAMSVIKWYEIGISNQNFCESCGPSTRRYILIGKHSELYICCRRIEDIGAVLSGDIF